MSKTFKDDDKLKRAGFAGNLMNIIDKSDELRDEDDDAFVMALNSSWGTGKTTFIEKLVNLIESDYNEKFDVIKYNAWLDDDFDNPLIAILSNLIEKYDESNLISQEQKVWLQNKAIKISKYVANKGIRYVIKNKLGIDTDEIIKMLKEETGISVEKEDFNKISGILTESESKKAFEDYKAFKGLKAEFIEYLGKLSSDRKVVFIIDELDRCNPLFAIDVLETMKHFFGVKNIVFLIAVDIEQLSHSIATVYGQNMDASGYLMRFFNLQLKLAEPDVEDYIEHMTEKIKLKCNSGVKTDLTDISLKFELSLRDINRVLKNLKLLTLMEVMNNNERFTVYYYFIALKYKYPDIYKIIMSERFLEKGNSSNGSFEILEDRFYKTTETTRKFLDLLKNDGGKKTAWESLYGGNNTDYLQVIYDESDGNRFELNSITILSYIERKLEFCY